MLGFLRGHVLRVESDSLLIETSGGQGYRVFCTQKDLSEACQGSEVFLWVESFFRQDHWVIIGFFREEDKCWFVRLTSVQGIGTKVALGVLSRLSLGKLRAVVQRKDPEGLKGVEGLGPTLRRRLVTELGKWVEGEKSLEEDPNLWEGFLGRSQVLQDVSLVAESLGYGKEQVRRGLQAVYQQKLGAAESLSQEKFEAYGVSRLIRYLLAWLGEEGRK